MPEDKEVNHANGRKTDNRPVNLELVSSSENTRHAHRTGLKDQYGQRNPAAKLTDRQVAEIRLAYACGGISQQSLAEEYGVRFQHISRLIRGQRRGKQAGPVSSCDHRRKGNG